MALTIEQRLEQVYEEVKKRCRPQEGSTPACTIIFSISDGPARAETIHATGPALKAAWKSAQLKLSRVMRRRRLEGRYLRVDWVTKATEQSWEELERLLHDCKRNFFRFGIAFDEDFSTLITEQECHGNSIYYGGPTIKHAVFNIANCNKYMKKRFPGYALPKTGVPTVWKLATEGLFCDEAGSIFFLPGPVEEQGTRCGLDAGRREIEPLTLETVRSVIAKSADWLARQVLPSGKFTYGYYPCFHTEITTYNSMRHATAAYALMEAWEYTGKEAYKEKIAAAVTYLVNELVREYEYAPGKKAAFLVDWGPEEIKVGGNGVTLLALAKWRELTGEDAHLPLMELLARGIEYMQDQKTGALVHVLHSNDLSLKDRFRTIYYDGETVFGLLRFYGCTGDKRWLDMARKSFDGFLNDEHTEAHDHWLSYSANEITRHLPEERYFQFGIGNCAGILDFVLRRETTYPTLMELMMAAHTMLRRLEMMPHMRHLLEGIDIKKFSRARDFRAKYLMNGFFWPENAMFFGKPDAVLDSFYIRHQAFRARIDDVEHNLSGLIAFAGMLERGEQEWEKHASVTA